VFERILIGVDDGEPAAQAVRVGAALATALGAQLALVHVVDLTLAAAAATPDAGFLPAAPLSDGVVDELRSGAEELVRAMSRLVPTALHTERFLREGSPAAEIIAVASEWGARLIVVGTHGRAGLERLLLGSTAEAVVRVAPCPVLTVRAGI
jgi:nucleotide-binding universal stress UspA family protein